MCSGLILLDRMLLNNLRSHFPALAIVAFQKCGEILGGHFIGMVANGSECQHFHIFTLDTCQPKYLTLRLR